jgi:CubicO group peptidase (beta-lactamase class C family)
MQRIAPALVFLAAFGWACGGEGGGERSGLPTFGSPESETHTDGTAPSGGAEATTNAAGTTSTSTSEGPGIGLPVAAPGAGGMSPGGASPSGVVASPLPRSTPEAEGVDSQGLFSLIAALDDSPSEIHSIMLVRHGKVIAEGWWAPYAPEDIHVLYSVTKSFNSTAVGFAVQEGLLGVDDLLLSHFADLAPAAPAPQMQNMRIRDLLTMSTGHETDSIDALRARADGQWTRAFLETSVPREPGTYFYYNSGAAYMLSALVEKVTGLSVVEYLKPRLFAPLGIEGPLWGESVESVNLGDGGLSVRTEDLAKFGQLYLQGGTWNGQPVLSPEWVGAASSRQISTGNNDSNWGYGYGYQFWQSQVGYRADGSLGQFTFILPEQDIVLAITSGTSDTNGVMNIVWQNLLPAVRDASLPDNPAALATLTERLRALALPAATGELSSALASDVSQRRYGVAQNNQGIVGLTLDFAAATPVLSIEDAAGVHEIEVGLGEWVRGRTGFKQRINELFDTPEQGIAAMGAWSAPDTFTAKLCFNETPYTLSARFRFQGEQVLVDMSYNVRWGTPTEPQLVGTR